jgi:hypothetical protein
MRTVGSSGTHAVCVCVYHQNMKLIVSTYEIGTLYQFQPLLAWRLMALCDFVNLVAASLRFFEGGSKNNWVYKKNAPPLYVISLRPGTGANCIQISPSESWGTCRAFLMALHKKVPV